MFPMLSHGQAQQLSLRRVIVLHFRHFVPKRFLSHGIASSCFTVSILTNIFAQKLPLSLLTTIITPATRLLLYRVSQPRRRSNITHIARFLVLHKPKIHYFKGFCNARLLHMLLTNSSLLASDRNTSSQVFFCRSIRAIISGTGQLGI